MKIKKIATILSLAGILFLIPFGIIAQTTAPSDPGGDPQAGGDPPLGGGAPLGGGMFILLGLGAAYGGNKLYHLFDEEEDEENEKKIN